MWFEVELKGFGLADSLGSAAWAVVSAVGEDPVITPGINLTGADQCSSARIRENVAIINTTNPTGIGFNPIRAIIGDQRVRDVSNCRSAGPIGKYSVAGVAREIATVGMDARILLCAQTNAVASERAVYDRTFHNADGGADTDSVANIVSDHRVPDVELHSGACVEKDTFVRKSEDYAIFDIHFLGCNNIHPANAVTGSIYGEAPDCDHFVSRCVDNNSGRQGGKNSRKRARTIDRN